MTATNNCYIAYRCGYCDYTLSEKEDIRQHIKEEHNVSTKLKTMDMSVLKEVM